MSLDMEFEDFRRLPSDKKLVLAVELFRILATKPVQSAPGVPAPAVAAPDKL